MFSLNVRRASPILGALLLLAFAPGCKDAASTITEKTMTAAKDTSKGIEEGVDKGRKSGESADGAQIVSSATDLAGKGAVTIYAVNAKDGSAGSNVVLAIENTTDKPLRLTKLEVVALDKEGFVKKATGVPGELTVLAKAKEKVAFSVAEKADTLAKIRVWDKELAIEPSVRK